MIRSSILLLLVIMTSPLRAQEVPVIQRAMQDEITRTVNELREDGFDKAFFVSCGVADISTCVVSATDGALTDSNVGRSRYIESFRLMMGDYDFNDESLDTDVMGAPGYSESMFPLDDNYIAIRRALWLYFDGVYKSASRSFARAKQDLAEKKKTINDVPHKTFARVPPSNVVGTLTDKPFNKVDAENFVRRITAVANDYDSIDTNHAMITYTRGYRYLVTSEGTVNRIPISNGKLIISLSLLSNSMDMNKRIVINLVDGKLPELDATLVQVRETISALFAEAKAPYFQEEYFGPVMFVGTEAAGLLNRELFGTEYLRSRNIIPSATKSYNSISSLQDKIGKVVFSPRMTVRAMPKLKSYNGTKLINGFDVDDEGVVPSEQTLLVEKGVLVNLMHDRTLVNALEKPNGLRNGPGVAHVTFDLSTPAAAMKTKLIELARSQGLDYGLMIRGGTDESYSRASNVYKVYVDDGREELYRNAGLDDISLRYFRKIAATSTEEMVYKRNEVSLICPQSIILEEIEVEGRPFSESERKVVVARPSKK